MSYIDKIKKFYYHRDVTVAYTRVYATIGSSGFIFVFLDAYFLRHNRYISFLAIIAIANLCLGAWLFEKGFRKIVKIYRPLTTMTLVFMCIQGTGGIQSPILFWLSNLIMGAMFSYGLLPTIIVLLFEFLIVSYFNYSAASSNPNLYLHLIGSLAVMLGIGVMFSKVSEFYFTKLKQQKEKTEEGAKRVQEKSREIRLLLDGIPQGVLTLTTDGVILPNYSKHLLSILETNTIVGDFQAEVLKISNLSKDTLDQCWQSILSIIGSDQLNYEANANKLLAEIEIEINGKTKFLACTWNIDIEKDIVNRILVTLLDVSSDKIASQKAEKQNVEFALIKELIAIEPKKITQFFASSRLLLHENAKLLEGDQEISHNIIQILFVNLHTVKGAARTLGLKELSTVLHEVEDYYHDILKGRCSLVREKLKSDKQKALQSLEKYIGVNRDKLNRKEDFSVISINREFIEDHYKALTFLSDRINKNEVKIGDLVAIIRDEKEKLLKVIYDQLPMIFDDYISMAEKIALDLGKSKPIFIHDIADVSIKPETRTLLDNCMIHLLRNALDHGIEDRAEREKKGKMEAGRLEAKAYVRHEDLIIEIADDGRGLAIGSLRSKGIQRGLLNPHSTVQDVAELIFHSGMSTSEQISSISGRGIGMDAVRSFLEKSGNKISIQLGSPNDCNGDFLAFRFEITLQNWNQTLAKQVRLVS